MARSNTGSSSNYLAGLASFVAAGAFSIHGWFKSANTTATTALVTIGNPGATAYNALWIDGANLYGKGAGKVIYDNASGGNEAFSTLTVGSTTAWNAIGGYRTGVAGAGQQGAYLNGVLGTLGGTGGDNSAFSNFELGIEQLGASPFGPLNGSMAEVGVWNVQLTDDEFASLAKGVSPLLIRPQNLVLYFPLYGTADLTSLTTGTAVTLTGSMPAADHPPIMMPQSFKVGQPAGIVTGYTLTADQGTYALTGTATSLGTNVLLGRTLVAAQGTYTLTGQDAAFANGKVLSAASGSYTLTGQDAGTLYSAATGLANVIIEPLQDWEIELFPGVTISEPGPFENPPFGYAVIADSGSYTLTGQAAGFIYTNRNLSADSGSYTLTGNDAGMVYSGGSNRTMGADVGVYSITGQPANLIFVGFDPGTLGQTVLSNAKTGGGGLPAGKSISYRRFEQINEIVAAEKEKKALAEREKAEKAKEAEAAKKAARTAQAKANIPPGQREIEDVTADQLIAKITANMKDLVRSTISEELDDLHASVGALLEHVAGDGGMPEAAPEVDPMVAPWKK